MPTCICQHAYDTGLTGVPKIDARLQAHYNSWLDRDAIQRDYDHYAKGRPYFEHSTRPYYCFRIKRQFSCRHRECEHARHRAPQIVKKMRYYIEQRCTAEVHYPDLNERIDRSGNTRPEVDNAEYHGEVWDNLQYRLHRFALDPSRHREDITEPKATSLDALADAWASTFDGEYGFERGTTEFPSLDAGLQPHERNDEEQLTHTEPVSVSWLDSDTLAEFAATQAAQELYGDREPEDVTLDRLRVWTLQREGKTSKPDLEPTWQETAAAVGEFITA